jgi:hypothetical protein
MEASDQLHAPVALPPGKEPHCPLDRNLGGPQSRSGRGVEEKNSQPLQGFESRSSDMQPVVSLYADWAIPVILK